MIFTPRVRALLGSPTWRDVEIEPDRIGARAHNALRRNRRARLGDLADLSRDEFLSYRWVGVGSLQGLKAGIEAWVADGLPADASATGQAHLADSPLLFSIEVVAVLQTPTWRDVEIERDRIGARAYNALRRNGRSRVGDLADLTPEDFLGNYAVGVKSLQSLKAGMEAWVGDGPRSPTDVSIASVRQALGPDLASAIDALGPVLAAVSTRDPRFGVPTAPIGTLAGLLDRPDGLLRGPGSLETIASVIRRLAELSIRPLTLYVELDQLLPPDNRNLSITRSRLGLDGRGAKTLDRAGREFQLTRERVRQIVAKILKRRMKDPPAYAPTLAAIRQLIAESGGAISQEDLANLALAGGLIDQPAELQAIDALAGLGIAPIIDVRRDRTRYGEIVYATDLHAMERLVHEVEASAGSLIGAVKRQISRRGIVGVGEVVGELEALGRPTSPNEVRDYVASLPGMAPIDGGDHWYEPADSDSSLMRRLRKPLLILGSIPTATLLRCLRRMRRGRPEYGPSAPASVILAAIHMSPFLEFQDSRIAWVGPDRIERLGIAEEALLKLFEEEGPALSARTIREALIPAGVDPVTLSVTLSNSPLIERLGNRVYCVAGSDVLPADVEDAQRRRSRLGRAVKTQGSWWSDGGWAASWDIIDPPRWSGVLGVSQEAGLDGTWTIGGSGLSLTVSGSSLWGIKRWVLRQEVQFPARLTLTFHVATTAVSATLNSLRT